MVSTFCYSTIICFQSLDLCSSKRYQTLSEHVQDLIDATMWSMSCLTAGAPSTESSPTINTMYAQHHLRAVKQGMCDCQSGSLFHCIASNKQGLCFLPTFVKKSSQCIHHSNSITSLKFLLLPTHHLGFYVTACIIRV